MPLYHLSYEEPRKKGIAIHLSVYDRSEMIAAVKPFGAIHGAI